MLQGQPVTTLRECAEVADASTATATAAGSDEGNATAVADAQAPNGGLAKASSDAVASGEYSEATANCKSVDSGERLARDYRDPVPRDGGVHL